MMMVHHRVGQKTDTSFSYLDTVPYKLQSAAYIYNL